MAAREDIQNQLNGKVHWDAPDWEIREWLKSKHGIEGAEADTMIAVGRKEKSKAIRKKSLFRALLAVLVALPMFGLAWLGMQSEGRRTTARSIALGSVGLACLGYAGKNLVQVFSGKSDVAIDA